MEQRPDIADIDQVSAMAHTILNGRVRSAQIGDKVVHFTEAKMKHLSLIISLFNSVIQSLDKDSMTKLVTMISTRQIAAIRAGQNPDDVPMPESDLVMQAFGNANILQHILVTVLDKLPPLVAGLSNITEEEFGELDPDHGLAILWGILVLNYGFFSERLAPTLRVLLGATMAKVSASQLPKGAAA